MENRQYELSAPRAHKRTLILLHGRDSTATEFANDFMESQDSKEKFFHEVLPDMKLVFPAARSQLWLRTQTEINQWFDMYQTEEPHRQNGEQLPALDESVTMVVALIHKEAQEVGYENVFLGGISQGCAVAIHALLHCGVRLGGFVGFSSWMPLPEVFRARYSDHDNEAKRTPVLLEHCEDDEVISSSFGDELCNELTAIGMSVQREHYPDGGHWLNEPKGFEDMMDFLRKH